MDLNLNRFNSNPTLDFDLINGLVAGEYRSILAGALIS